VAAQLADSQEWLISMELEKSKKFMAGNELGNSGEKETAFCKITFLASSCSGSGQENRINDRGD
jgi:hypothetical protein